MLQDKPSLRTTYLQTARSLLADNTAIRKIAMRRLEVRHEPQRLATSTMSALSLSKRLGFALLTTSLQTYLMADSIIEIETALQK